MGDRDEVRGGPARARRARACKRRSAAERNALRLLPVEPAHVWALDELPGTRGDPFDRMLAAQAAHEGMVLVTRDARMRELRVRTLW